MSGDARSTALEILNTLKKKKLTLDTVMEDFTGPGCSLSRRDRALTSAIVYGVMRWRGTLDFIINHYAKNGIEKINPKVLNILRIGLFQIKYLTRIPDSAAVNTSVELAKASSSPAAAKFVNAVLRNAIRNPDSLRFPDYETGKTEALAAEKSFPLWLLQKWIKRWGEHETIKMCDCINKIPPITIRTNTLKTTREDLAAAIGEEVEELSLTPISPTGISFSHPKTSIPEMAAFKAGLFQVQDEAAQLVSILLDPRPGDKILDACAGLGGKTGHIAQLMENRGEITAMDSGEKKLRRLMEEMKRLGISIVKTATGDLTRPLESATPGMFDKILIDAPCSGMGVLRRNPDSKWNVSKKNLSRYKKRQVALLSNLSKFVKPSGIMVYAVCSTELEENEAVIDSFLHANPDFQIDKVDTLKNPKLAPLVNKRGFLTTLPHRHQMDGFFSARLKKLST